MNKRLIYMKLSLFVAVIAALFFPCLIALQICHTCGVMPGAIALVIASALTAAMIRGAIRFAKGDMTWGEFVKSPYRRKAVGGRGRFWLILMGGICAIPGVLFLLQPWIPGQAPSEDASTAVRIMLGVILTVSGIGLINVAIALRLLRKGSEILDENG